MLVKPGDCSAVSNATCEVDSAFNWLVLSCCTCDEARAISVALARLFMAPVLSDEITPVCIATKSRDSSEAAWVLDTPMTPWLVMAAACAVVNATIWLVLSAVTC